MPAAAESSRSDETRHVNFFEDAEVRALLLTRAIVDDCIVETLLGGKCRVPR